MRDKEQLKEYHKQYYLANKEKINAKNKKYKQENKEKVVEYNVQYNEAHKEDRIGYRKHFYLENKDIVDQRNRDYVANNKEKRKEYCQKYYQENKERIKARTKVYNSKNKEKIRGYYYKYKDSRKEYAKNRAQEDQTYKMKHQIRTRMGFVFNKIKTNKPAKTEVLLGATYDIVKKHIEKQFVGGMAWENYGKHTWHIDHIIPLASAKDIDELIALCHYSNLQPLWAEDNLRKADKLDWKMKNLS